MLILKSALMCAVLFPLVNLAWANHADAEDAKPHIVMLIAEKEYDTKTTLPKFAQQRIADDYTVSFVYPEDEDPNVLDGIEQVRRADVLLVSVRRRTLPVEQLAIIRDYVQSGKPVIGIRTASHAFCVRDQVVSEQYAQWPEWDHEVFGGNYTNHYGKNLTTIVSWANSESIPAIFRRGMPTDQSWAAGGTLYKTAPLAAGTQLLLTGAVPDQPSQPVAWTYRRPDGGASFYTSLGHRDDFAGSLLPQLLVNAIEWSRSPDATE